MNIYVQFQKIISTMFVGKLVSRNLGLGASVDWLILFLSLTWYILWKKVLNTMLMILKMIKV